MYIPRKHTALALARITPRLALRLPDPAPPHRSTNICSLFVAIVVLQKISSAWHYASINNNQRGERADADGHDSNP